MPLSVKTDLIPLDQGLNSYGNWHRQPDGVVSSANGVALDKDGYVYPGLQLSNYATAGGAVGSMIYAGATYTASATAANDVLLAHSASPSVSPAINIATGGNAATSQPLFPFYQATQTVYGSQPYTTNTLLTTNGAPVVAVSGTQLCYAWLTTTGVVMFMREDLTTGERESPLYLTLAGTSNQWTTGISGGYFKVGVAPNYNTASVASGFAIFALGSAGTVTQITFQGVLGSQNAVVTTLASATSIKNMDVAYDATQTYVLVNKNNTELGLMRSGTSYAYVSAFVGLTLASTAPICIAANSPLENPGYIAISTVDTSNKLYLNFYSPTLGSPTLTSYTGLSGLTQIGIAISKGVYVAALELSQSLTFNGKTATWNYVSTAVNPVGTGITAFSGKIQAPGGVALLGKPWPNSLQLGDTSGAHCLIPIRTGWNYSNGGTGASQIAYPNAYLVDTFGNTVAKWGDRDVGSPLTWPAFDGTYNATTVPMLHQPALTGSMSAVYAWPQLAYTEGQSIAPATFGQPINPYCTICKTVFTSQTANTNKFIQLGPLLIAPTAITASHDGCLTTESGFFTACPQPVCSLATGSGLTSGGAYYYVGVMQYQDASGRYHYSAPSLPVLAPTPSGSTSAMSIAYPVFYQSLKNATINNIRFLTYRTQAGGSSGTTTGAAYYLVNSSTSNVVTIPAASGNPYTASFTDTTTDTAALSAPKIYTSSYSAGASAGTAAPPPFFSTCVWQNCVWGAAYRNGWELWFSWPLDNSVFQPEGVAWSSANRIPVPSDVGQVQGIASLDANLIILGTNRDYLITGSAPARSSTQLDSATFSSVSQLPTPSGMRVRNGVCTVPQGLCFQGTTGMMLLDRSLTYNDIGNTISDIVANTNYGAGSIFSQANCVVFSPVSGTGPPLAWYYEDGRWSVPYQASGALSNWNQVVALSPFRVNNFITNVGLTTNSTSPLIQLGPNATYMQARSPWIEMAETSSVNTAVPNVSGYGRLFEVQAQGDLRTDIAFPYTLTLQTEYDYVNNVINPPDVQTITVRDSSQQAPGPADLAWRFGFTTCQAKRVRFTLTFDATAGNFTLPLTLPLVAFSGLMLYYGVDDGLARTGQALSSPTGS